MRCLILSYDDYFNIPYIQNYEKQLQCSGIDYDIVLWNRSGQPVDLPNAFVFSGRDHNCKLGKILPFLRWRRFALSVLKKNHYDRLILLTTMPAVLLADQLLGAYRGKYWLDIRDFTYENIPPYKALVAKLVYGAASVSISSPAFQSFLPNANNICLTHNISNQNAAEDHCHLEKGRRPLTIGFVGGIQFQEQNEHLLRKLANHPDYRLKYVGKPHLCCDLPAFCKENHIENAEFLPAFTNDQKPAIYRDIDLINSIYGCDTPVVKLLLPNRLYDCVLFKKPILVSKGTYLAQVVAEYDLGLAVDAKKEPILPQLDEYIRSFKKEDFEHGCQTFLATAERDMVGYHEALSRFCTPSHMEEKVESVLQ